VFNVLHPRETAKTVTIFDVDGLSLGSVAGEPLEFIRRASHVMQVRKNEGEEIRRRRRKKAVAKGEKEGAKRRVASTYVGRCLRGVRSNSRQPSCESGLLISTHTHISLSHN
jgi:hypothetical protein